MAPKRMVRRSKSQKKRSPSVKKTKPPVKVKERKENEVWYNAHRKCLVLGPGTVMRGVHHVLHSSIVTPATEADIKNLPHAPSGTLLASASFTEQESQSKLTKYQKGKKGHARGKMVHSHIEKICNKAKMRKIHPQAELAFRLMDKIKVKKEAGELGVFWREAGVATPVDIVTRDLQGRRRLGETKTGELSKTPKWRLRFKPYTIFSNHSLALLQVLIGEILHVRTFPTIPLGPSHLYHLESNVKGYCYEMPSGIQNLTPLIQQAVAKTRVSR